jgi:hypothetical protein
VLKGFEETSREALDDANASIEPVVIEFACSSSLARLVRRGGAVAGEDVSSEERKTRRLTPPDDANGKMRPRRQPEFDAVQANTTAANRDKRSAADGADRRRWIEPTGKPSASLVTDRKPLKRQSSETNV